MCWAWGSKEAAGGKGICQCQASGRSKNCIFRTKKVGELPLCFKGGGRGKIVKT